MKKSLNNRILKNRLITIIALLVIIATGITSIYAKNTGSEYTIVTENDPVYGYNYDQTTEPIIIIPQANKNPYGIKVDHIDMPDPHLDFLYEECDRKGLDFALTLAVIKHESQFQAYVIGNGTDYGYMQVTERNHEPYAEKTGTLNKPLDPYINITWGTQILKEAFEYWENKGVEGDPLITYALSSYNKGIQGTINGGIAQGYVDSVMKELDYILERSN